MEEIVVTASRIQSNLWILKWGFLIALVFIPLWAAFYNHAKDMLIRNDPLLKVKFFQKIVLLIFGPILIVELFVYCSVRLILDRIIKE